MKFLKRTKGCTRQDLSLIHIYSTVVVLVVVAVVVGSTDVAVDGYVAAGVVQLLL